MSDSKANAAVTALIATIPPKQYSKFKDWQSASQAARSQLSTPSHCSLSLSSTLTPRFAALAVVVWFAWCQVKQVVITKSAPGGATGTRMPGIHVKDDAKKAHAPDPKKKLSRSAASQQHPPLTQ